MSFGRRWEAVEAHPLPIPHDCTDRFLGAYWRRPHACLDLGARGAISTFSKLAHRGGRQGLLDAPHDPVAGVAARPRRVDRWPHLGRRRHGEVALEGFREDLGSPVGVGPVLEVGVPGEDAIRTVWKGATM